MPVDSAIANRRVTFETAAEHVCTQIPVAAPNQSAGEVRQTLLERPYERASHIVVCEGDQFCGILRIEELLAAPAAAQCVEQQNCKENMMMWWHDLLWGFWNGVTAWLVFLVHVFGGWTEFPFYNMARSGNWYDFGFLLGAGSPFLGALSGKRRGAT